jgi:hypothetical protein
VKAKLDPTHFNEMAVPQTNPRTKNHPLEWFGNLLSKRDGFTARCVSKRFTRKIEQLSNDLKIANSKIQSLEDAAKTQRLNVEEDYVHQSVFRQSLRISKQLKLDLAAACEKISHYEKTKNDGFTISSPPIQNISGKGSVPTEPAPIEDKCEGNMETQSLVSLPSQQLTPSILVRPLPPSQQQTPIPIKFIQSPTSFPAKPTHSLCPSPQVFAQGTPVPKEDPDLWGYVLSGPIWDHDSFPPSPFQQYPTLQSPFFPNLDEDISQLGPFEYNWPQDPYDFEGCSDDEDPSTISKIISSVPIHPLAPPSPTSQPPIGRSEYDQEEDEDPDFNLQNYSQHPGFIPGQDLQSILQRMKSKK